MKLVCYCFWLSLINATIIFTFECHLTFTAMRKIAFNQICTLSLAFKRCCLSWVDNISYLQSLIAVTQMLFSSFNQQIIGQVQMKKIVIKLVDQVVIKIWSSNLHQLITVMFLSPELCLNIMILDKKFTFTGGWVEMGGWINQK